MAKVDNVFPVYIQKSVKGRNGKIKTTSVRATAIDKVMIHNKSYVVAKGSMKVGDDVVVIRPGTKIDLKKADKWLSFIHNGNVRISRKCGVISHGVVIPNKVATRIIKKFTFDNMREISRENLDQMFHASRRFTHEEKAVIADYQDAINEYTKAIREIEDGE